MEGLIVPSKFYGIAAAGRPVIAVADADGEVARLVARYGCGEAVAPGDSVRLAEVILAYASNPDRCARAGEAARAMLDRHFRRDDILAAWNRMFVDLAGSARAVH